MPSTRSSSFSSDLPSSTVITPSLPTLSIASEMILPMLASALAEIEPTCAISLEFEHDVAALGPEGDLDGVGQDVQAVDHLGAGAFLEPYFFGWHCCVLLTRN